MRRLRLLAAAATVASAFSFAVPAGTPAQAGTTRILFGLNDKWETQIVNDEAQIGGGYHSGIVGTFLTWDTSKVKPSSVVNWSNWVRNRGAAPMLDLYPPSTATLSGIAHGYQDANLRAFASALKGWGHPFLFRLFPEMNGNWESYSPGTRGQTAAQFIAAWRHVVTVFRNTGARNVKFVWNPDRFYRGEAYSFAALWPGRDYVDWVALDGYNWHDTAHGNYLPYALLKDSVDKIRAFAPAKPLMIAELGVHEAPSAPSSKPSWISYSLPAMARLGAKAVVWFNENASSKAMWRLDTSRASLGSAHTTITATTVTYAGRSSMAAIDKLVGTGSW